MLLRNLLIVWLLCGSAAAQELPRYVGYVKVPYIEGQRNQLCDGEQVAVQNGDGDLMLRDTLTGEESVLFDADETDTVIDPRMSVDGEWVYFSLLRDSLYSIDMPAKRYSERPRGADIFKLNLATRQLVQLTDSESENDPVPGATWQFPVFNTSPCPLPNGRVLFTSNRQQLMSPSMASRFYRGQGFGAREPTMQLYAMKDDGSEVELLGHLNLGSALHPVLLNDGWVMWSSLESQGNREKKHWALWKSTPDLRHWQPLWSPFRRKNDLTIQHSQAQSANGRLQLVFYYPTKMIGYGSLYDFAYPVTFGSDRAQENLPIVVGNSANSVEQYPFQPITSNAFDPPTRNLTPWARNNDGPGTVVTHPAPSPQGLLVSKGVFSTFGESGTSNNQIAEAGIYLLPAAEPTASPAELVKIVDEPNVLEVQPFYAGAWSDTYGSDPPELPWLPNETGEPFGWIGTSTVFLPHRQSKQVNGEHNGRWLQGSDTDEFAESEFAAVRIVAQYPTGNMRRHRDSQTWVVDSLERMAVLGDIPLQADGSFLAKVPAGVSITFQGVDAAGRVLVHSPTWHQLQPGETWTGCRGCHGHSVDKVGPEFSTSIAGQPGFEATDLTSMFPVKYEFARDVKPILQEYLLPAEDDLRDSDEVVIWKSRRSPLMSNLEDAGATPEQLETVARWIDLGAAIAGPADEFELDTIKPALWVGTTDPVRIGANDIDSDVTLTATVDGVPVEPVSAGNAIWDLPEIGHDALVVVTATDAFGNTTRLERHVTGSAPDCAELQEQVIALQLQVESLEAEIEVLEDKLERIGGIVNE